jgi:hypothetical protein
MEYWEREHDRVLNGYTVGDTTITGKHYLYLNYLPILRSVDEEFDHSQKLFKSKYRKRSKRTYEYVDFWDEDYILFHTWDIAKNGVAGESYKEQLENLKRISKHLTIPIVTSEENLAGGKNHLWLKPRGVGASWKGAVIPIYNQFFINFSTTFLVANEEKFLTGDGLYTKYITHKDTLNGRIENWRDIKGLKETTNYRCAGFRRAFSKQAADEMHFRAAKKIKVVNEDGQSEFVEVGGKRSSVYGLPINNKPSNIRGKRGDIVYEEFGTFAGVAATWEVAQQGVEQDGAVFATQYGFGTGGDETNINIKDLTTMFYDPVTYNILEFTNIYDEELYGLKSSYFTSALSSLNFKDKDGNTDKSKSKAYFDAQREVKKLASDPNALINYCAEKPYSPAEALSGVKGNIFPVKELKAHKTFLINTKLHISKVTTGRLKREPDGRLIFNSTEEPQFIDYPIKPNTTVDSPICIVYPPKRVNGVIPKNMYRLSVDPYRNDSSTGNSIGSIYVIENTNRFTHYKGDMIVAWYNARPNKQDEFNRTLYNLAEYYNCQASIENDEPGGIIDYGKRMKCLHLLKEEFKLAYDESIKTKGTSKKQFGMHMASGKDNKRIKQGDKYIQEWLLTPRTIDENGKTLYNLHFIYDLGIIEELIEYGKYENYDRISSLRVNMYDEREFLYDESYVEVEEKELDSFFESLNLFQ